MMSKRPSPLRRMAAALALLLALQALAALALPNARAQRTPERTAAASEFPVLADFESGAPPGFFSYNGGGSSVATTSQDVPESSPLALPGQVGTNTVLSTTFSIADYGGFGVDLSPTPQDWSNFEGLSFWFYGRSSGLSYQVEILDNRSDPASDTAERWDYNFTDDFSGWQLIRVPFSSFTRATDYQPGGAPDDGLTLNEMWGFAFPLPLGTGDLYLDQVALYNPSSSPQVRVQLDRFNYSVQEGDTATIIATLNITSTSTISVSYATVDDTASAGSDYGAAGGTLVFPPGAMTQSFSVVTQDDSEDEADETLTLELSNPINASLGSRSQAPLTIGDNDTGAGGPSGPYALIDDFESGLPTGSDADGSGIGFVTWHDPSSTVALNTTTPPDAVPTLGISNTVLQLDSDIASWGGFTHAFEDDSVSSWVSQDWSSYQGISFWLYGQGDGTDLFVDILDNRNPGSTSDDAERFSYSFKDDVAGWRFVSIPFADFSRKDIGNGAPNDGFNLSQVHGWALGSLATGGAQTRYLDHVALYGSATAKGAEVAFESGNIAVNEGETATISVTLSVTSTDTITISYRTAESHATPSRDFSPAAGTLVFAPGSQAQTFTVDTHQDSKYEGDEKIMLNLSDPLNAELGFRSRAVLSIVDTEWPDPALQDDFEGFHRFHNTQGAVSLTVTETLTQTTAALPGQGPYEGVLQVDYDTAAAAAGVHRAYVSPQDWSAYEGISFWYYGTGSGETITTTLYENRSVGTGDLQPDAWSLLWSDEFNDPAGTPPDPNAWQHEVGDGTLNNIPGWGNNELEYYSTSTDNAATDGDGNLAITARKTEPSLTDLRCWYGSCEWTSARLISRHRVETEYGRIEARIKVPDGGAGLWPAFWMLGDDINTVGWPASGEIDIMEYVSREPNDVFGTIHGPGYSGGASYGDIITSSQPISASFHTFTIEWEPGEIRWYMDGTHYHTATPADVAPNEWVFEHPFFLLLNLAVGGNFGGPVEEGMSSPQTMLVDYVRLYGAAESAERFEASFADEAAGWQKISLPFSAFKRSADQPSGAPDDGLTLQQVWGYGFELPADTAGSFYLDQVRLLRKLLLPLMANSSAR